MQKKEELDLDLNSDLFKCLARKILTRPLYKRRQFLAGFETKNGEVVTDRLKLYIKSEFNKQKKAKENVKRKRKRTY